VPLYTLYCPSCRASRDEVRPVAERNMPTPCTCGADMQRQPELIGVIAHNTKGGHLMHSTTTGSTWKGNRKPKTIGKGHGLGGRPGYKPPRIYADPPEVKS
jgi:hypothetical protein